jgi:FkbM family methyltransferase
MSTGYLALSTEKKMAVARKISSGLCGVRRLFGKSSDVIVERRGGIKWNLNLRQGIDLAIFLGMYEPETSEALLENAEAGDVVLDIGANIGAHTLPLAKKVGAGGRVLAIEPTTYALGKLKENVALNPEFSAQIEVVSVMLGDGGASMPETIPSSWPLTEGKQELDPDFLGEFQSTAEAQLTTLDDLVSRKNLSRIDLIKLDVDGFEFGVLNGARETIRQFKPRVLFEVAPYLHDRQPHSFDGLLKLIGELGFRVHELGSHRELALSRESFPRQNGESVDVMLIS